MGGTFSPRRETYTLGTEQDIKSFERPGARYSQTLRSRDNRHKQARDAARTVSSTVTGAR